LLATTLAPTTPDVHALVLARELPFGGSAEDYRLAILRTFPGLLSSTLADPGLSDPDALHEARNHARLLLVCLEHGLAAA
jgi:hypothetical protein